MVKCIKVVVGKRAGEARVALVVGDHAGHALLANMALVCEWLATARLPKNNAVWVNLSRKWRKTYVPGIALEKKYTRIGHVDIGQGGLP